MANRDELYMKRCLEIAKHGAGSVAPNPMVGALLIHDNKIIGEGYHKLYGREHAEVNCIRSVNKENERFIQFSTLFVSLEPCTHHGKTPPCADLIIENKIPKVVIGCRDLFDKVNGRGIEKLKNAGIEVIVNLLYDECFHLNRRFFTYQKKHRPYIVLKWAQSNNAKIANLDYSRSFISNEFTNRLVHKWRSEESSILVGTNTALQDDPQLTTRLWPGKSPLRVIVDLELKLPQYLKIFNGATATMIINLTKHEEHPNLLYYQVTNDVSIADQIIDGLFRRNIQSVIVEGGARLLQTFIDEKKWDEARIITNEELTIENGLAAPELKNFKLEKTERIFSDKIDYYFPAD
jgi:diaminohydroxyphosphoribosylaminopyrimidine deaminase / 5-amino-6-(5-phosphoribosylamino)uracil reductase